MLEHGKLRVHVCDIVFLHLVLPVCGVVDRAQQDAAVLGRVRKPCEVDAPALSVFIDYQAAVLSVHIEDLVVLALRVDTALSFAEIDLAGNVFQNKVFAVWLVVLIGAHGEAKFSVNTQHVAELEETPLILAGARLAHADEPAALVHEPADRTHDLFVFPVFSAAPGGVGVPGVDDHADIGINAVSDLVEVDELDVDRHSAQTFDHTHIGVDLAVPQRVVHLVRHPPPDIAPAV